MDSVVESPLEAAACIPRELLSNALFLLGRLGVQTKTETMEAFEAAGYSPYHYSVLALLEEGERATQAAIADTLGLNKSLLVGFLDELEDEGLIERRRDPNDRRRQMVKATAKGRRRLAEHRELARRLEREMLEPLTAEERATLQALLLRVAAHRDARYGAAAAK
jgi:DNA-binding MarR family transcriptional regulator